MRLRARGLKRQQPLLQLLQLVRPRLRALLARGCVLHRLCRPARELRLAVAHHPRQLGLRVVDVLPQRAHLVRAGLRRLLLLRHALHQRGGHLRVPERLVEIRRQLRPHASGRRPRRRAAELGVPGLQRRDLLLQLADLARRGGGQLALRRRPAPPIELLQQELGRLLDLAAQLGAQGGDGDVALLLQLAYPLLGAAELALQVVYLRREGCGAATP